MVKGNVVAAAGAIVSTRPIMVQAGETVTSNLVVRGDRPFQILKVQCPDNRLEFAWSRTSASVQPIAITFTAGATSQKFKTVARIETDNPRMPVVERR